MTDTELLSRREAGKRLGITGQMVSRYCAEGMPLENDKVLWPAAREWYAEHKHQSRSGSFAARQRAKASCEKTSTGVESFVEAQRRKESALADLRQLEHRQKSGELIEVAVAERFVAEIGSTFRDALLSLPERFAAQLAAMTLQIEIRDLLRAEVRRILTNLPTQIRNGSEERRGQTQ